MNATEKRNLEKYIENILNVPVEKPTLSYTVRPEYDMYDFEFTGKYLAIIFSQVKGKRRTIATHFACDTESEAIATAEQYIKRYS